MRGLAESSTQPKSSWIGSEVSIPSFANRSRRSCAKSCPKHRGLMKCSPTFSTSNRSVVTKIARSVMLPGRLTDPEFTGAPHSVHRAKRAAAQRARPVQRMVRRQDAHARTESLRNCHWERQANLDTTEYLTFQVGAESHDQGLPPVLSPQPLRSDRAASETNRRWARNQPETRIRRPSHIRLSQYCRTPTAQGITKSIPCHSTTPTSIPLPGALHEAHLRRAEAVLRSRRGRPHLPETRTQLQIGRIA